MTARARRILVTTVLAAALGGLIAAYVSVLMRSPEEVGSATGSGGAVELTLQTVAALGPNYDGNPNWVSYLVKDGGAEWVHSTSFKLPANTLVRVTILQYDSATGLRNPFFGRRDSWQGGMTKLRRRLRIVRLAQQSSATSLSRATATGADERAEGTC